MFYLLTYLPANRWSPVQVLSGQCTDGSQTCNLLITSPTPYCGPNHYTAIADDDK